MLGCLSRCSFHLVDESLCGEVASGSSIILRSWGPPPASWGWNPSVLADLLEPPSMDQPTSSPPHGTLRPKLRSYRNDSGRVSQRRHSCEAHRLLGPQAGTGRASSQAQGPSLHSPEASFTRTGNASLAWPVPLPQPSGRRFKSGGVALNHFLCSVYLCASIALTLVSEK